MLDTLSSLPLVQLLRRGSRRFNLDMAVFIVVAGLSNAGLLMIINAAAENARNEAANGRLLAMFAIGIALYIYTQRIILFTSIREVERILSGIRERVAERIGAADLMALEHVGRSDVYGTVSRETQNISQAAGQLIVAAQSSVMVFFTVIYLAMLSWPAFFITVGVAWISLAVHFRKSVGLNALLREAQQRENEFLGSLTHLLEGFKEVRMSRVRRADLLDHMRGVSASVQDVKTRAGTGFATHYIFVQVAFYGLLAAIVFLLPRMGIAYSDVIMKLTAAILFIIGPLGMIVNSIPVYSTANVAAANIYTLEHRLEASTAPDQNGRPEAQPPARFARVELRRATFLYDDQGMGGRFQLGPIDLSINAGEVVFIMGGNGSGKSTLLKTLTGLYSPNVGSVVMDDVLVTPETSAWYRSHFAAVFSDYHLFDRLYGFRDVSPDRVKELLKLMEIEDKTGFVGGRFTTIELSSGQRKRLALIVALLEDRPILVLDEWAADQDPAFRKFFYEHLLKDLKAQGKTIIAATHDDRYFGVADRVVKMEYGQFVPYSQ
jgi:putative pyoverdin transport system ATP-binding/permease protein